MKKIIQFLLVFMVSLAGFTPATAQQGVPDDYCINEYEYRLYELINRHRLVNGLQEVPLSTSLCFVARTHVIDLFTNHPDTGICNLNSWSDKGDWTSCCHNKYVPKEKCIRGKPAELTGYTADGYELTYAELFNTHPDTVFRFWKKIGEANAFLVNTGRWEEKTWRAMGVGIYRNYAVLWMGQRKDVVPAPEVCEEAVAAKKETSVEDAPALKVISSAQNRYYLIVASFQSEKDARREAEKYLDNASNSVSILKSNQGQFRVSINDYEKLEEAKQAKEKLRNRFSDLWILNF